jgi:hypothetical protein
MAPRRDGEETTSVTSILVDQMQDLNRSQRDQGEKLASLATSMNTHGEQLKAIAVNMELIRAHFSDCPARSGWESISTAVRELQHTQTETGKVLAKANLKPTVPDSGTHSLPPKGFTKGPKISPTFERILYALAAVGSAIGAYLAGSN